MEKKSVNGKSFDEVFAERGKSVQPEKIAVGKCYLLEHTLCAPTISIAIADGSGTITDVAEGRFQTGVKSMLFHNTQRLFKGGSTTFSGAFRATKDQIALLNSYRNA